MRDLRIHPLINVMSAAPIPYDEQARLEVLRSYHVLDTEAEKDFDELTELASQICQMPVALISLVDQDRQWFKARTGNIDVPETPRDVSFCAYTILKDQPLAVEDARRDARFSNDRNCRKCLRPMARRFLLRQLLELRRLADTKIRDQLVWLTLPKERSTHSGYGKGRKEDSINHCCTVRGRWHRRGSVQQILQLEDATYRGEKAGVIAGLMKYIVGAQVFATLSVGPIHGVAHHRHRTV
jgi:hypothetical protein